MVNFPLFRQHALYSMDMECFYIGDLVYRFFELTGENVEMGQGTEQSVHCVWGREGAFLEGRSHNVVFVPPLEQEVQYPKVHMESGPQANAALRQSRSYLCRPGRQ